MPRTVIATKLDFNDASSISVNHIGAKIQNSYGGTFVYNHKDSALSGTDKDGHTYTLDKRKADEQKETMQKAKRATQTGKQYAKFLPKEYQRKIRDLTREKNKVKRAGTTLTRSKSKAKKTAPTSQGHRRVLQFRGHQRYRL